MTLISSNLQAKQSSVKVMAFNELPGYPAKVIEYIEMYAFLKT